MAHLGWNILWASVLAALVIITCATSTTTAQVRFGPDAALWGARMCVGETSWENNDECVAQVWVILKRAAEKGITFVRMARRFSSPIREPRPRVVESQRAASGEVISAEVARGEARRVDLNVIYRRMWVKHLHTRRAPPRNWPSHLPWRRYRPVFRAKVNLVQQVFDGEIPDPCPDAINFGSRRLDGVPDGLEPDPACLPESTSGQAFYRRIQDETRS